MESDSSDSSKSPEAYKTEYIAIATVGRPVGLEGWCRIYTFGGTLEKVKFPFETLAGMKSQKIPVTLKEFHRDSKGYRGLFEGYESREDVYTLKNCQLFIEQDKLKTTEENEFYHFELEGMSVFCNKRKEFIGKVINVYNYPTVDALEVKKTDGHIVIIPMTEDVVEKIDKDNRKIFICDSAVKELL